jgi:serine phosphatase RsbU (regulator of sigma subunit)
LFERDIRSHSKIVSPWERTATGVTIRSRLTLSFITVLALFGISLGVYSWSARLHEVTMRRLDHTLQRRVVLATMRQDLDNLQKQVALLSQSELAADSNVGPPNPRIQQLFDEKAHKVSEQIASLKSLSEPEDAAPIAELESSYASVAQAWKAFYEYLGVEPAWAVASAAKADPLSFRLQTEILPRLQEVENRRVEMAEARFSEVEALTNRITSITFLLTLLFATAVALLLSRSIVRGFRELQQGADLIGNMNLEHRIPAKSRDEFGQLAHSFNSMTERLELARKELTEANEELERRNQEIKQRQAKELQMAATIQHGLMDVRIPELPFASIRARNVPCTEIGGDFFDIVPLHQGVAIIICDVSGKGISAAIMASMLQGMIRSELAARLPLTGIVTHANRFFTQRDVAGKYATLCILRLQPDGTLEYVNCGHVAPILVGAAGIERLDSNNPPVGLLPDIEYGSLKRKLQPGERIVLVTDGVTEAGALDGQMFGDERLELAAAAADPFEAVFAEVAKFCGEAPLDDDCTVVEIAFSGAKARLEAMAATASPLEV